MTIDPAKIALSGVVVSALLFGPALAPQAHAQGNSGARSVTPADHRKATASRQVRHTQGTSVAHLRRGPGVHAVGAYASSRTGSARTAAFVDDSAEINDDRGTVHASQHGLASWYGGRWHGRRTSSGNVFDQDGLTAAHPSLPMGTRVRVSVVGTGRDVVVTINDRPGTRSRIIDLSRGAARELGILERGVAMVTLTPL